MKVGLIREGKIPIDKRVPLSPNQALRVAEQYPQVDIVAHRSDIRCFADSEYEAEHVKVVDKLDDCDIIMGVKEVPIKELIPNKTYLFFSHTIKAQAYNRELLQEVLKKNIKLIDYETLTDENNHRVIAFGRWAGIVGAYNAIWTFGKRYNLFKIRRAHECFDLQDLKKEYEKVELPAIKIAITGGGRVAKGAMEVLHGLKICKVSPAAFLEERFDQPVFTQLNSRDYHKKHDGGDFNRHEFFDHPHLYEADFLKYAEVADMLIAAAYWDPQAPKLFTPKDVLTGNFQMRIIADITCDIEGSIPATKKASTIEDPIYDYNASEDVVEKPLIDEANLTVMAVDNLPCELPRDASESFGEQLIANVLPHLLGDDNEGVIKRATIAENGELTPRYSYLKDYVNQ